MHIPILRRLREWTDSDSNILMLPQVPDEVKLADYYFGRSWPGMTSVYASSDNFKPSSMMWLIRIYRIKSLLDADVGRGNRMVACSLESVRYIGVSSYLPMKSVFSRVIMGNRADPSSSTMLYGNFDDILIGEYQVDAIFLSFGQKHTDVQVCARIIKAWNNLDAGKLLFIHSESFDRSLRLLVSQAVDTLIGIEHSSDKIYDLPSTGSAVPGASLEKIRVLRKVLPNNPSRYPVVELKQNAYRYGNVSLMRRAMQAYVLSLGKRVHYLCSSHIYDSEVLSLAEELPSSGEPAQGRLSVYLNGSPRWKSLGTKLSQVPAVKVQLYLEDSNDMRKILERDLTQADTLLPDEFNSPLFEACLIQALLVHLPQESGELIAPERIWVETEYSVLIRALLQVWRKTTLLVSTTRSQGSIDRLKRELPSVLRGRVIFHTRTEERTSLSVMRANLGYKDDSLMMP